MIIHNEFVFCIDVDGTLVDHNGPTSDAVNFMCPLLGDNLPLTPNLNNIRLLKEKKRRGYFIVVWSQGGAKYANAIVDVLNLEQYVDLVITKPVGLVDDLPAEAWMPKPVWIDPKTRYKR